MRIPKINEKFMKSSEKLGKTVIKAIGVERKTLRTIRKL
jgi:hypothetical protein